jgi:hypothetical protein
MSTRTHGGPSGVFGLLDHETQVRPCAQKSYPHEGKRGGTGSLRDGNGAVRNTRQVTTVGLFAIFVSRRTHPLLSRSFSGALAELFFPRIPTAVPLRATLRSPCVLAVLKKMLTGQTGLDPDRTGHLPGG